MRVSIFAIALLLLPPAFADTPIPPIHVYGEDDGPQQTACNVSHASAILAVGLELQRNHVPETFEASPKALNLYVSISSVRIVVDQQAIGCAISYSLQMEEPAIFASSVSGLKHKGHFVYCTESGIMSWGPAGAQDGINADLRTYVDECLSKYRKNISQLN